MKKIDRDLHLYLLDFVEIGSVSGKGNCTIYCEDRIINSMNVSTCEECSEKYSETILALTPHSCSFIYDAVSDCNYLKGGYDWGWIGGAVCLSIIAVAHASVFVCNRQAKSSLLRNVPN